MPAIQNKSIVHIHSIHPHSFQEAYYLWTLPYTDPFNELLISWNASRPPKGHYAILSRLLIDNQWTPWLLFAVWGGSEQFSFYDALSELPVRSYQDQVEALDNKHATGFCVKVVPYGGANLEGFYSIYACTSKLDAPPPSFSCLSQTISLPIPNISQLSLNHPRSRSICSAASTTAVVQYLQSDCYVNPLQFARQAYDAGFDIYGNWSFNVAQAFVELGNAWQCFCARLCNIEWLWNSLKEGRPIVASIKGSLPGAPTPYTSGHLIVIKGYDAKTKHFLCMDPAFPSDEQTEVAYPWQAFMQAWENRHYLAYFFIPRNLAATDFFN